MPRYKGQFCRACGLALSDAVCPRACSAYFAPIQKRQPVRRHCERCGLACVEGVCPECKLLG